MMGSMKFPYKRKNHDISPMLAYMDCINFSPLPDWNKDTVINITLYSIPQYSPQVQTQFYTGFYRQDAIEVGFVDFNVPANPFT